MSRITRFVQDSWQELKKVNWPTPLQARNLTVLVLAVSAAVAIFVATFDTLFGALAKAFNVG